MFKQCAKKVESNPLRRALVRKGWSVRSAARELGISPAKLTHILAAHDDAEDIVTRIKALPDRSAAA